MKTSIWTIFFLFLLFMNLFADNVKIQANKVSFDKDGKKTSIFEGDVVVNTQKK